MAKSQNYDANPVIPDHYGNGKNDLLTHLEDLFTPEEFRGALKMNIMKYIMREENKNGIEDLDKAKEYVRRLKIFEQHQQTNQQKAERTVRHKKHRRTAILAASLVGGTIAGLTILHHHAQD